LNRSKKYQFKVSAHEAVRIGLVVEPHLSLGQGCVEAGCSSETLKVLFQVSHSSFVELQGKLLESFDN